MPHWVSDWMCMGYSRHQSEGNRIYDREFPDSVNDLEIGLGGGAWRAGLVPVCLSPS